MSHSQDLLKTMTKVIHKNVGLGCHKAEDFVKKNLLLNYVNIYTKFLKDQILKISKKRGIELELNLM